MPKHRILVPFDFTPVSEVSIEHAFVVGKAIDSEIILLHVVGNKKDFPESRARMEALLERCKNKYTHNIRYERIQFGRIIR